MAAVDADADGTKGSTKACAAAADRRSCGSRPAQARQQPGTLAVGASVHAQLRRRHWTNTVLHVDEQFQNAYVRAELVVFLRREE